MIFMVRFCFVGPRKPLEVCFSQHRGRKVQMMLCCFFLSVPQLLSSAT